MIEEIAGVTPEQARALVERQFGRLPDDLAKYEPEVGGDDSFNFRFQLRGEPLLLKVMKRRGTPVGIYFHERIKAAGIPVPDLVRFDPVAGPGGQACAIWTWADGRPAHWSSGGACPYDEFEFGKLLRRIHELRFDGPFGLLGDDLRHRRYASHPDLGPVCEFWPGFFHWERAARRYRDRRFLNSKEADALAALPRTWGGIFDRIGPRLLHMGDIMHHGNLIVGEDGRISAVVDYVEAMAGDPRWELAWVDYYFSDYPFERPCFDMSRFRAGYGTDHNPHDLIGRFYLLAILIFEKLLFFTANSARGKWALRMVKELLAKA